MAARACALLLAVVLLSGCAGDSPAQGGTPDEDPVGGGGTAPLDASASVQAPEWAPGQWWEWEVSYGTEVDPTTFCSIVLSADGAGYELVTEQEPTAKQEAAYGRPLLGAVGRDLSMAGWGAEGWSLLSFPLTDGKAWTSSMPNIAWDIVEEETVELAMAARFDADVGQAGGFRITGTVGQDVLVEAEYDPSTGWFSSLRFFDVDPGQEELELGYRAKSVGHNYTGPFFRYSGDVLLQVSDRLGFTDDPTQGGEPFAQPGPYASFTMDADTTLYGVYGVENVAGARAIVLVDPNGDARPEAQSADLDGGGWEAGVDEPGIAGEWRLATAGAGGYSGAYALLFQLTDDGSGTM